MMRGVYTVAIDIATHTAAKTLAYLTAPATMAIEILSAVVSNMDNDTNEQWDMTLQRITTIGTPTGTTITPTAHEKGDGASAVVSKGNVTASEPSYTANKTFGPAGVPSLGGWRYDPTPEERPILSPSESFGLRNLAAMASTGLKVSITFREIGG